MGRPVGASEGLNEYAVGREGSGVEWVRRWARRDRGWISMSGAGGFFRVMALEPGYIRFSMAMVRFVLSPNGAAQGSPGQSAAPPWVQGF